MPERTRVQLHVGRLTLTRSLQECLVRIEKAALEREQLGFIMFVWNRHPQGALLAEAEGKAGSGEGFSPHNLHSRRKEQTPRSSVTSTNMLWNWAWPS